MRILLALIHRAIVLCGKFLAETKRKFCAKQKASLSVLSRMLEKLEPRTVAASDLNINTTVDLANAPASFDYYAQSAYYSTYSSLFDQSSVYNEMQSNSTTSITAPSGNQEYGPIIGIYGPYSPSSPTSVSAPSLTVDQNVETSTSQPMGPFDTPRRYDTLDGPFSPTTPYVATDNNSSPYDAPTKTPTKPVRNPSPQTNDPSSPSNPHVPSTDSGSGSEGDTRTNGNNGSEPSPGSGSGTMPADSGTDNGTTTPDGGTNGADNPVNGGGNSSGSDNPSNGNSGSGGGTGAGTNNNSGSNPTPGNAGGTSSPTTPSAPTGPSEYQINNLKITTSYPHFQETSEIGENRQFGVSFSIDGPRDGSLQFTSMQRLVVMADVNFNNRFDIGEVFNLNVSGPTDYLGYESFRFIASDDGIPWDDTPRNQLKVLVQFADRQAERQVTVVDDAPQFTTVPNLSMEKDSAGNTVARVTANFADEGFFDQFDATIKWGDDVTETNRILNTQTRTVSFTRVVTANTILEPLTITIKDDDGQSSSRKLTKLDVIVNNDDDNQNSVNDDDESGFSDDDLKSINLEDLKTANMNPQTGKFKLHYGYGGIRLWTTQTKSMLILPTDYPATNLGIEGQDYVFYSNQSTVWVESIALGESTITMGWTLKNPTNNTESLETFGNAIHIYSWGIDLDIDSNNNSGKDPGFEHDVWNEYLEDSPFAVGKMIYTLQNEESVPITLDVPQFANPNEIKVRLALKHGVVSTGTISIWKKPFSDATRLPSDQIGVFGDAIVGVTPRSYSLSELGAANGRITLYVDKHRALDASSFVEVDSKKPEDFLEARLFNSQSVQINIDRVKYMIVTPNSFYPALFNQSQLRSAGASEAVYGGGGENALPKDNEKFTLQMLTEKDLRLLFNKDTYLREHPSDRDYLLYCLTSTAPEPDEVEMAAGLRVRLYLDHSNATEGRYILSFRGTDFTSVDDWLTNVQQFLTGHSGAYHQAMRISQKLSRSSIPFETTGHSMGGGLAAAAALEGEKIGVTFNAAGINPDVFLNDARTTPDGRNAVRFPTALLNYANASKFITSYQIFNVKGEILPSVYEHTMDWIAKLIEKNISVFVPITLDERFGNKLVADAPDILSLFQRILDKRTIELGGMAPITVYAADGKAVSVEGLHDLTFKEFSVRTFLEYFLVNYLDNEVSYVGLFVRLLDFKRLYLQNYFDLGDKLVKSHSMDNFYYGFLYQNEGNNAYDRESHDQSF